MVTIIIGILTQFVLATVLGGLLTWLTGKILHLEELTYRNSMGVNAVMYILNPFVPFLFFFLDYYSGGTIFSGTAPETRAMIGLGIGSIASIVLMFFLLKYAFGWDTGQTCLYCIGQSCISVVFVVALVILFMVIIGAAMPKE